MLLSIFLGVDSLELFSTRLRVLRWPLELIAFAAAVAPFVIAARSWRSLPERIPTSYGFTGEPNRWGGRWLIWMYPVLTAALYLFVGAVTDTLNWPGAGAGMAARALLAAGWVKALLCILPGYYCWITVRIAQEQAERASVVVFYAIVALILLPNLPAAFQASR